MEIALVKPALEELSFRQALMADEKTMEYNHAYGGVIPFPRENWSAWYQRWILDASGDHFYRYILDQQTNAFVGETAYHREPDTDRYLCDVIILDKYRGKGYGKRGLSALCDAARSNGLARLYDEIAIDNPALALFLRVGFTVESQNKEFTRVWIEL